MRLCRAFRRTIVLAEAPKRTPYDLQLVSCASHESGRSSLMRPPSSAPAHFFRVRQEKKPAKNYLHSLVPARLKGESCAFDTSFYQALEYPNSGASTSAEEVIG